ncbi:YjbF family lipoprotein [Octadecabacter sp. G9-8]|uniref:YjbF family lipoprotein n=1 Tax=Octadecabacter dasysiphoniae TaxID=2909341 RepID=A0ABS9CR22_9RHOB|nr:YjbF family lipoprotein [Octadecabacter dasysiphoniae]MCF2869680.1 YjbF family lipoprotein [Octadecabacter dasysiphoniae]
MKYNAMTVGLTALLVLGGCGQTEDTVSGIALSRLQAIGKPAPVRLSYEATRAQVTPELLEQIGIPVIIAHLESLGGTTLMAERARNGAVTTFMSDQRISISFNQGVIVATRGLGNDLMSANVTEVVASLDDARSGTAATRIHTYLDGENQTQTRQFNCSYNPDPEGKIIEACRDGDVTFENQYWRDQAGVPVASRQWIGPQLGYLIVEHLQN